MGRLVVVTREGERKELEGDVGLSVMEVIRAAGLDELLALCGGNCSCATCHVYVSEADLSRLPPMSSQEDELLESSEHRKDSSRLSCQLRVEDGLAGLDVHVAPED